VHEDWKSGAGGRPEDEIRRRTVELEKALDELERLNLVTRKMNSTLDRDQVLDLLIDELGAMFSFEGIAILLLAEDRTRLKTLKLRIPNMPPERIEAIILENEAIPVNLEQGGGVARAVLEKQDYYFDDVRPEELPEGPNKRAVLNTGLRSVLIMPLLVDDEVIGVMIMSGYTRTLGFAAEDLRSIRRFVNQISQAVRNSQMHARLLETTARLNQRTDELERANVQLEEQKKLLELLSRTDELTGIRNRRAFFERAADELERCRRFGSKLFVFLFDIDGFKEINDAHGHGCGDAVLQALARTVERVTRKSDLLARYGGEEFIVASFDSDMEGAAALAERIRRSVEEQVFGAEACELRLTVSIGYTCFPSPTGPQRSIDDLVREADAALYRAKAGGKNRCVYAHGGADGR
jgi:diguanylate cyclase (GGDEF)-like protein